MPKTSDGCRYTGSELSPKGLGFCAHLQREGVKKIGADGNKWEVRSDVNGRLRWVKASSVKRAITKIKIGKKKAGKTKSEPKRKAVKKSGAAKKSTSIKKGSAVKKPSRVKKPFTISAKVAKVLSDDKFWKTMAEYDRIYTSDMKRKVDDREGNARKFLDNPARRSFLRQYMTLYSFLMDVMFKSRWVTDEEGKTPYCGADDSHWDFVRWMIRKGKKYVNTFLEAPRTAWFAKSCRLVDSEGSTIDMYDPKTLQFRDED